MDEWDTLSTKTETNVKLKGSKMSINTTKTETETDVKPKGSDMSNDTNPCSVAGIEKTTGDIVKVITGLYTKGVRNKFELAKKVVAGYDSIDGLDRKEFIDESKPMSVYDGIVYPAINEKEWEAARAKLRTSFNKSLPFTETSASKFNRIGRTEWLMKFDAKKLPNDYSFLYYLTSKEVNEKPDILNLVKETLSAKSSITTIKKIISDEKDKAAKEKAEKEAKERKRLGMPDPETDIVENFGGEASSKPEEGKKDDGVANSNPPATPTFVLAVKTGNYVDTDKVNELIEKMEKLAKDAGFSFSVDGYVALAKAA